MIPHSLPQSQSTPTPFAERSEFYDSLVAESLRHPSLHHPWLKNIAAGNYTDMHAVLRDYALEYAGYSEWFPRYLRQVIARLDSAEHRALLTHNLEEEAGELGAEEQAELLAIGIDPNKVAGVPHPELFRRFCRAMDISDADLKQASAAAQVWREKFLRFLQLASPAAAVGALGLGTESVVRPIYQQLLAGIQHLGLRREDYVFFELHCTVDDQHALDLRSVAIDMVPDARTSAELRFGMVTALRYRNNFWDHLETRANRQQGVVSA